MSTIALLIVMLTASPPVIPLAASLAPMEHMLIIALEQDSARLVALLTRPGLEIQQDTSISAFLFALLLSLEIRLAIVSASQSAQLTSSHKTIQLGNVLVDAIQALMAITSPVFSTRWTVLLAPLPMMQPIYATTATLLLEPGVILFLNAA